MALNPRPWDETFNRRYLASLDVNLIREGKEWRTQEAEAGRPSSFADWCKIKGFCSACAATGILQNDNGIGFKVVDMDGDVRLFADCEICRGTGRVSAV